MFSFCYFSGSQQRSGTPTKDEIYTPQASTTSAQPPLPPTSPQFMHQAAATLPPSYHPMYAMQPPPPLPSHMNLMSMPPMQQQQQQQQLMLDSASYHQGFMYNQPPPQLSPLATNPSQTTYQYPGSQSGKSHDPNSSKIFTRFISIY